MTIPADTIHLSMRDVPERDRIDTVREVFGRLIIRLDLEPLPDGAFDVDVRLRALPNLSTMIGNTVGVARRTPNMMHDGNEDVVITMNVNSTILVEQRGRESEVRRGDAFLSWCAEPATFVQSLSNGHTLALRVPRAAIAHLVPDIEDRVARVIPRNNVALRLLGSYLQVLDSISLDAPDEARFVIPHIHDLVALAIGTSRDGQVMAARRGMRAARLSAIEKDVASLIGPREITAEFLAARHGVSARYIRMLFEQEGRSLWAFVLEQRLERAKQMLTDVRFSHMPISAIAFEVGFGDLSYFNRNFRRRFGMSPSDVRNAKNPNDFPE